VTLRELETTTKAVRSGDAMALPGVPLPIVTFDDMLDRHQAEIYRFAMQLTRNRADADDLYQETLIKAYRAFDRLDGSANHRAWLYRIATNTFLSGKRKAKREDPLDETLEAVLPADPVDHVADFEVQDLLAEVQRFVAGLPDKQRIALVLRKYHEMDYTEIAINLKCSEAAARANVHEALRKLRTCFGDRI
jgi:RNA polymerase sigma-70 factor (ECF subfamily)